MTTIGLHNFKRFSRIIHAISDDVTGPFTFADVVVPSVAHNTYPLMTPQGQLLVYYIGSRWNASEPPNCSKNAPDQPPDDVLANINVAYSPSGNPSGPWEYHTNVFPNNTRAGIRWVTAVTNPAPLVLPNGTALMAFHGVEPKGTAIDGVGGEAPGIAVAESWRGPFRLLNKEPIFNSLNPYVALNGTAGQAVFRGEDFFLWQDTVPGRGWYHLLWHVKQPFAYVYQSPLPFFFFSLPSLFHFLVLSFHVLSLPPPAPCHTHARAHTLTHSLTRACILSFSCAHTHIRDAYLSHMSYSCFTSTIHNNNNNIKL